MKAKEKIQALQALMKKEGIDGYLIPSSDPHMSEYLPDHYTARSWFSGFNGSAGTLAVTSEKAALWADGRYFIQAEHQLCHGQVGDILPQQAGDQVAAAGGAAPDKDQGEPQPLQNPAK